jgi:cyclopropane fatty-acyl-phospholipid synthase-like methyltransferase
MTIPSLIDSMEPRVVRPGLRRDDCTQIAVRGFGDARNSYPHSMAWFNNFLYVGTTRDNLCLVNARHPFRMQCWPVQCTTPPNPQELRAQIWRYDPRTEQWEMVHISPMIMRDGREVMRDIGYRGMTVFQGKSDDRPVLYLSSWSATGARIMRSEDGRTFADVGEPGLGHPSMVCFRTLQPFRGRLYTSPVGKVGQGPNVAELPVIFESDDPARGRWRIVNKPGFGDPANMGIFELADFNGHLYAGTLNPTSGFQLWKTRAEGEPPYHWTRVLTCGAYRGLDNESLGSFCTLNGVLYAGTGIMGGGYNRYQKVGPAAAEVIRVHPDDSWELLVGMPRATPDGMKIPLSGLGPGFNNFFNGYSWRMCEHEGWLYVSTYNWGCFLPFLSLEGCPESVLQFLEKQGGVEALQSAVGGGELWRTQDGVHWHPVTLDGFGSLFNYGIRTMSSTPYGFFIGTANPFGPLVGVKTESGWRYQPNPRGGCEIWLGRRLDGNGTADSPAPQRLRNPERVATRHLSQYIDRETFAGQSAAFYDESGFDQMGYWGDGAQSARQACEHLMERLLTLLGPVTGRILDVECGRGGSTRYLAQRFSPSRITTIGRRNQHWLELKRALPGVTFLHMEPTEMDFPGGAFEGVVCVERAGYFTDRAAFLNEAFRILQPGGRLVLADSLYSRTGETIDWSRHKHNYVRNVQAYRALLVRAGFADVRVIDATRECALGFQTQMCRIALARFQARQIDTNTFNKAMSRVNRSLLFLRHYLLAAATKSS